MNKNELMKLTKVKLEEHGRTIGLELDKRKKKQTLVEEILAHRKTLETKVKNNVKKVKTEVEKEEKKAIPIIERYDIFVEKLPPVVAPKAVSEQKGLFSWIKSLFS